MYTSHGSYRKKEVISSFHPAVYYLILLIVCCFAFIINNQVIPADLMESRNLATAQEMVREGNYLVPTMNGELRLEKPPLPTWIAAGVEKLIPGNLMVQRYMAGLSATLMVIFLYLTGTCLTRNRNIGLLTALILATCFNVVLMGRTATWDIYCHSFMTGAIYFFLVACGERGKQWGNFLAAGLFLGLSFLSKGPVSFYALLLPFLISYILVLHPSLRGKKAPLFCMILIAVIVSCWWMIYILIFHSDMALAIAQKESTSWINHNVRPWYYYWQFPAEAGIWALFLVTSVIYYFTYKKQEYRREYTFSILWLILSLILLSLIPEKKTRYLLPILVPAALSVAFYIYYQIKCSLTRGEKFLFRLNAFVIAIILLGIPAALYLMFFRQGEMSLLIVSITGVLSWGLALFIFISIYNRGGIQTKAVFVAIILTMIMIESVCLLPIGDMFINDDRHSIRMLRDNEQVAGLPFFYNPEEGLLRMELVYEANKTIRPIDLSQDAVIYDHLPFVLVSGMPIDSLMAGKLVEIEWIDQFDNNWRKVGHKRHNPELVREVAIIRGMEVQPEPEPIEE